jgi:hypothetical protein
MRSWIPLLVLVVAGALYAPNAGAAAPLRDRFDVDVTFPAEDLTAACGVPITVRFEGRFSIQISGNREIDTQPGTKLTYANAAGATIRFPFSVTLHATYPQGIVVGAPVIVTITGNGGGFAGEGAGTGRLVYDAVVEEVDDGFGFFRFTDLISQTGSFGPQTEKICSALA